MWEENTWTIKRLTVTSFISLYVGLMLHKQQRVFAASRCYKAAEPESDWPRRVICLLALPFPWPCRDQGKPFGLSRARLRVSSAQLWSILAKNWGIVQLLCFFFPAFPPQDHMLKIGPCSCVWVECSYWSSGFVGAGQGYIIPSSHPNPEKLEE